MNQIFSSTSPYIKQARFIAILWTLLIFVGCFTPAYKLPEMDVPFVDKWTHFVMFGGFTFLWLCAKPALHGKQLLLLIVVAIALGIFIEFMQLTLTFLKRSGEFLDGVADAVGSIMGVGLFFLLQRLTRGKA